MDNWDDATQRGQKPWKTLRRLHTAFAHFAPLDHSIEIYLPNKIDVSTKANALHLFDLKNDLKVTDNQHYDFHSDNAKVLVVHFSTSYSSIENGFRN